MQKASIVELLQRHRAAAGLTQEELAERATLSARSISDLERGVARHPYPHTVQRLIQALGLGAEDAAHFEMAARRGGREAEGAHDPAVATSPESKSTTPHLHLPLQPTPFIGRQQEVEDVTQLLQRDDVRLPTLTGPGGVGKTRLALRVAGEVLDPFPDGIGFLSLASLADAGLVPSAIATTLGVTGRSGHSLLEALAGYLSSKKLLLVLDNFEHLLPAGEVVSQLLVTCPQLTILVTSRVILHLAAEHQYPVPPLLAPIPGHLPDLEPLSQYDAIQLFVQRAAAVKPGFGLTDENAAAVAEICYQLDGLPLAIELAAARIRLLPPHSLVGRLGNRLGLLTGGPRDQPARQQTLRKTIDWSHGLLKELEQALFARLSVFAGGCTIEAAEAVCDSAGELDILDGITILVEQSLVVVMDQPGRQPRFGMLETVREYARERLEELGDEESLRYQHCLYYLSLAEEAEPELWRPEQVAGLDRLEAEHDNLRAALRWLTDRREVELGLRLASALATFWGARGYLSEGRKWLEELLPRDHEDGNAVPLSLRAKVLQASSALAFTQGNYPETLALTEHLQGVYRELADWSGVAYTRIWLAHLTLWIECRTGLERPARLLEEGLALARELEDQSLVAFAILGQARVAQAGGDLQLARTLCEQSLMLSQSRDVRENRADLRARLARMVAGTGEPERMRASREGLALQRAIDINRGISGALWTLVRRPIAHGDYAYATALCEAGLALDREMGYAWGITMMLEHLATVATEQGQYRRATSLAEESLAISREWGLKMRALGALMKLSDVARARGDTERLTVLGEETLAQSREQGVENWTAFALHNLSHAARLRGDYAQAVALCEQSLAVWPFSEVFITLGWIARDQGDDARAQVQFIEGLTRVHASPEEEGLRSIAAFLEGIAGVVGTGGEPARAVRLFGAADTLRSRMGTPIWPVYWPLYQQDVAAAREALGGQGFQAVWEEGRAMSVKEAVAYALGETQHE